MHGGNCLYIMCIAISSNIATSVPTDDVFLISYLSCYQSFSFMGNISQCDINFVTSSTCDESQAAGLHCEGIIVLVDMIIIVYRRLSVE